MHPELAQAASELPAWVQLLATGIGLLLAAYGLFSAQLKNLNVQNSPDVIVPQMTIADSQAMRDLAEQMRIWAGERQTLRNISMDMLIELRQMNSRMDDIYHTQMKNAANDRRRRREGHLTALQDDE